MAVKTSTKLPKKPFTGEEGNSFSKDNQPPAELKKLGWQKLREQRLLTQNLLKLLLDENGIPTNEGTDFFKSLLINAKDGNAKAIDVVINTLEDQKTIQEIKHTVDVETVTFK